jgi:transcriptional regulator with XRE-family HTH domain
MHNMEQIGAKLRHHRMINLGLSIEEMAELAGLSWPTVAKIEKDYPVKWESVEKLAKACGYCLTVKLEPDETNED